MKLHANARTCPKSRRLLVDRIDAGWSVIGAAEAAGITDRTARRWMARWRAEGVEGLLDRSSAPKRIPRKTPPELVREIVRLRRLRMTASQIATALQMALSTVSAVLSSGSGWASVLAWSRPSRLTVMSAAAPAS